MPARTVVIATTSSTDVENTRLSTSRHLNNLRLASAKKAEYLANENRSKAREQEEYHERFTVRLPYHEAKAVIYHLVHGCLYGAKTRARPSGKPLIWRTHLASSPK